MTEPTPESTEVAEAQGTETTVRRGRPRPETTITRDNEIFDYLASAESGMTRSDLVEKTGLTANEVYLSLHRLRKDGRIERTRQGANHLWAVAAQDAA